MYIYMPCMILAIGVILIIVGDAFKFDAKGRPAGVHKEAINSGPIQIGRITDLSGYTIGYRTVAHKAEPPNPRLEKVGKIVFAVGTGMVVICTMFLLFLLTFI